MIDRTQTAPLLAGVIGKPILHSKSPLLHNYWLKHHGISGHYIPLLVEPKNLSETINALVMLGFRGVNVTLPHKSSVLSLVDTVTDRAAVIGAANTLYFSTSGKITADNTDGYGFTKNIYENFPTWKPDMGPAVIFGAGGAAKAVVYSLLNEGVKEVRVLNRTKVKSKVLAENFGNKVEVLDWYAAEEALKGAYTVINATSLGMIDQPDLEIELSGLKAGAVVVDLVYNPLNTQLLRKANHHKFNSVTGIGMLIYQAELGFQNWFGCKPDITEHLKTLLLSND